VFLLFVGKIRCPCDKCQNLNFFDQIAVTKHIWQNGFAPNYETCVFHGGHYTTVVVEEEVNDQAGTDRMDEMLEAIQLEFNLDTKDPPMPEVEEFFRHLKASKEPLHRNTQKWPYSLL
jgi:hypothetical protein